MRDYRFGNLITRLREEHGYSQFQLGKLLRVSGKAVSKWENGSAKPRTETCCRLAEILGISLDELLSGQTVTAGGITAKETVKRGEKRMKDREDYAREKHIELHLRTGFSGLNGFGQPERYLELAERWGQPAVAFTDYSSTRGFPSILRSAVKRKVKAILGCEILVETECPDCAGEADPVMILVRNREGLVNLNRILTDGFLRSGTDSPCVTWETLNKYRKGLLVGYSCNSRVLPRLIREGKDGETIRSCVSAYDYLEIEPVENTLPESYSDLDLAAAREERKQIMRIGKETGIPVVAVGNICFPNPENAFDYAVLRYNSGEIDEGSSAFRYMHTTEEMLEMLRFLGKEDCRKAVIENPRTISGWIEERISLYPEDGDDKCGFWPGSESDSEFVRLEARKKAFELYGSPLPEPVQNRLETELVFLRSPQAAFQFALAAKLIRQSEEAGYPVSSRGFIASSLTAMLIGITDINPLDPHYRCPKCGNSEFNPEFVKFACGADLPERICGRCGSRMTGDGYRIPYQILFGEDGTKPIDIDLNFSGEYQEKAHRQIEDLYGKDRVCYAGTAAAMNFDRAERYIRRYLKDHGMVREDRWIEERANSYWNVVDRTGCHPGGIVIATEDRTVAEFTPLQYAGEENTGKRRITHYDFNSMRDVLLKMDCLAHDTPTLLHLLRENTGIDPQSVPLKDEKVFALFWSTEALGISERELLSKTASYGIPDYQNAFAQRILKQIMPETVEDLIRVSGWEHGTDVWIGNAESRIADDPAAKSECPASRDDIMNSLLDRGMPEKAAFRIMEDVRKGKGIRPEFEQQMKEYGISKAYIEGCRKIKYLFPKAHAVSYVENSLRVAWYKVYRPEAFYQSWLRLLGDSVDETDFRRSPSDLRKEILELRNYDAFDSRQDIDRQNALELILEAGLRGIRI